MQDLIELSDILGQRRSINSQDQNPAQRRRMNENVGQNQQVITYTELPDANQPLVLPRRFSTDYTNIARRHYGRFTDAIDSSSAQMSYTSNENVPGDPVLPHLPSQYARALMRGLNPNITINQRNNELAGVPNQIVILP